MMANNFEIDDRMTDESKRIVENLLSVRRPADLLKLDIKVARELSIKNEINANSLVQFENLSNF